MKTTKRRWTSVQTYGPSVDDLLIEVCEIFSLTIMQLQYPDRRENVLMPRIVYIHAAHLLTDAPTREIARPIRRERSNISHHKMEVKKWIFSNDELWFKYWNKYIQKSKLWEQYNIDITK